MWCLALARVVLFPHLREVQNMSFFRDLRVAFYSLMRTQGLAITVILTLALGIGANAAIFTLVRGVLLKPLVSGDYFEVMGLHPVLGRLIGPQDDGPKAAGVVVLTYRFWATTLGKDPGVM